MGRASCFDVPAWHSMLWSEQAEANEHTADIAEQGDARVAGFSEGYMPELFHRLYAESPNAIAPESRDRAAAARGKLHDLASELPEFETLRKQTVRDPMWAGMAATTLAGEIAQTLPERFSKPPDADKGKRILEGLRGLAADGVPVDNEIAETEGQVRGLEFATGEQAESLDPSTIRQAIRRAIETAQEQIDSAQAACAAFGMGDEAGAQANQAVACELARRVRNSPKLARIVELAGRLVSTARAKQATKSQYARKAK